MILSLLRQSTTTRPPGGGVLLEMLPTFKSPFIEPFESGNFVARRYRLPPLGGGWKNGYLFAENSYKSVALSLNRGFRWYFEGNCKNVFSSVLLLESHAKNAPPNDRGFLVARNLEFSEEEKTRIAPPK